jgi:hypothetical protein
MTLSALMRIKLLFALCLFCAGCAGDPFQTFYVPGYQLNAITGRQAYSGPPLPPGTAAPPVEYLQIVSVEQAKSLGQHFAALGYCRIGTSIPRRSHYIFKILLTGVV